MTLHWKSESVLQPNDFSNVQSRKINAQKNAIKNQTPKFINEMKLSIRLVLVITFCCISSLCCVSNAESYYYSDENDIKVSTYEVGENSFGSLIHKDFFSIFSSDIKILNSVENQSLNEEPDEKGYATNIESDNLPNFLANQIPIAKLSPTILNFKEQPIGLPNKQIVVITNIGKDFLSLESISGDTMFFYCAFFSQKVIPPGGNSSFNVYFLARNLGFVQSAVYINTNKGIIKYNIQGIGINNKYKIKPLLKVRILVNTSFTSLIHIHNPHNTTMQILEIFSSDDDLHIEVPANTETLNLDSNTSAHENNDRIIKAKTQKTSAKLNNDEDLIGVKDTETNLKDDLIKHERHYHLKSLNKTNLWSLEPFESKSIGVLRYLGRKVDNHTALVWIRFNTSECDCSEIDNLILPVEIEVTKELGLYSPIRFIDFGLISLKNSTDEDSPKFYSNKLFKEYSENNTELVYFSTKKNGSVKVIDLYLTNYTPRPLKITEISSVRHNSALSILLYDDIELPANEKRLTKVAELRFDPKNSKRSSQNYGKILIKTNDKSHWMQMNFVAEIYSGNLEFSDKQLCFRVATTIDENANDIINSVELVNNYLFPIVVRSISLNNIASKLFEIIDFKDAVLLPGLDINKESSETQKIKFKLRLNMSKFSEELNNESIQKLIEKKESINKFFYKTNWCTVHTNFSSFQLPINIFDSLLSFKILNEASYQENDLILNPIKSNSIKEIPIQIYNHNPIDISFDKLEIRSLVTDSKNENKLDLSFLYFESLQSDNLDQPLIFLNSTFTNSRIQKELKIPAHHSMTILLTVTNVQDAKNKNIDLISILYKHKLVIETKYQKKQFKITFQILRDSLELVYKNTDSIIANDIKYGAHANALIIHSFPTRISTYQLSFRSKSAIDFLVYKFEFQTFGDSFEFSWDKNPLGMSAGLIKSFTSRSIGSIEFNPQFTCIPFCYSGIQPRQHTSIIDTSSLFIDSLRKIDISTEKSQIYDLWLKTFSLKPLQSVKNLINQPADYLNIDTFLFSLFKQHWLLLRENEVSFFSSVKIFLKQIKDINNKNELSYRFPVRIDFNWPRLIRSQNKPIDFPLTQIHSGLKIRNIIVHNPSNNNILVQAMLASNVSHPDRIYEFIQAEADLFYYHSHDHVLKSLLSNKIKTHSFFQLRDTGKKLTNPDIIKQFSELNIQPDFNNSFIFQLKPNETRTIQIEFNPEKLGTHYDILLLRNNLTILDAQLITSKVGTAELRINNLPPMKSSSFLNNLSQEDGFVLTDFSNLVMKMTTDDFELCTIATENLESTDDTVFHNSLFDQYSHILDRIYLADFQEPEIYREINLEIEKTFMSQLISGHDGQQYKSSFRSKEGVVLRGHLIFKNVGNTDLHVLNVAFDGESCYSRGIEVISCNPFTIAPFDNTAPINESVYLLEIRYRPDFTMATIRKRLVLETNIGLLRYLIEIQIPHNMLSICHDSLPRPPLESHLFYLGFFLVVLLIIVMLLTSLVESRSIIKYQYEVYKQLYALNDPTKSWLSGSEADDYGEEVNVNRTNRNGVYSPKNTNEKAKNYNQTSGVKQQTTAQTSKLSNRRTIIENLNKKTIILNSHSHRNLTKSRSIGANSDSSVSSCSSAKKINSSPKAEKASKNIKSITPPPVNESEVVVEVAKTPVLSVVKEPETKIAIVEQTSSKASNSKTKVNKKLSRQNTDAATHNENLSQQRKNYLNQQKSQLGQFKSGINETLVNKQQNQVKFNEDEAQEQTQLANPNNPINPISIFTSTNNTYKSINQVSTLNNPVAHSGASSATLLLDDLKRCTSSSTDPISSAALALNTHSTELENIEIEMLNNQLQQLQEQNKQQLQKISYFESVGKVTSSDSSESPSPNSTSSNSSTVSDKKQPQTENQESLFDIILKAGGEKQKPQELASISSNNLSGLFEKSGDDIFDWPIFDNRDETQPVTELALSTSPALSDSWIMLESSAINSDDNYNKIVQETENLKKNFFDSQQQYASLGAGLSSLSEEAKVKNQNLDKLLYSLISQQEFHKNQHRYAEFQPRQLPPLKSSLSTEGVFNRSNNTPTENSFLGPIQRPRTTLQINNYVSDDQNFLNYDPNSNRFEIGSNLKLTGEDIAMLSALFSAKSHEMANKTKNSEDFVIGHHHHNQNNSKSVLRSTKSSDDSTRFHEFRLFDNLSSSTEIPVNKNSFMLDNYNIEAGSSGFYWPLTNDDQKSETETENSKATPWNSVLLNDFDGFGGPPSLSNSSSGNHIKNLWTSTGEKESSEQSEMYAKVAASAADDQKNTKNLKFKKN